MREGKREDAIVMQMSQPSVLFVAGNLISSCGATIQSRWNVKNAPTRSGLRRMGGVECWGRGSCEQHISVSDKSQPAAQTSHSQVTHFLFFFFPQRKSEGSEHFALEYQFIKRIDWSNIVLRAMWNILKSNVIFWRKFEWREHRRHCCEWLPECCYVVSKKF